MGVGEIGVGEIGVGEMRVGEMGVGEMRPIPIHVRICMVMKEQYRG